MWSAAGEREVYTADIVVVGVRGAVIGAADVPLGAATRIPNGLANGSDQVGRNYMRHNNSAFMAVSREPNDTVFQKTMALSDFYFGADDWEFPLGEHPDHRQVARRAGAGRGPAALPATGFPSMPFDELARHSIDFWVMTEDLPRPENRITLERDGRVVLDMQAHRRRGAPAAAAQAGGPAEALDAHPHLLERSLYLGQGHPDRRHRAPGGHHAVRDRSRQLGARPRLPGARGRQPLCGGRRLLPLDRRGEPDPDDHRQRAAGRRPPRRTRLRTSLVEPPG